MDTAARYRQEAAELRRTAERPGTPPDIRSQYLALARKWEEMAERAEGKTGPRR